MSLYPVLYIRVEKKNGGMEELQEQYRLEIEKASTLPKKLSVMEEKHTEIKVIIIIIIIVFCWSDSGIQYHI